MATTSPAEQQPIVPGVVDTRGTSLDRLAAQQLAAPTRSLRNILPADEPQQLAVCAFASSI